MPWPALMGVGIFVAFSFVLGGRLLSIARRTRKLPELAMGIAFISSGGLGFGLQVLAQIPGLLSEGIAEASMGSGKLLIHVGVACQVLFTWRVFRPDRSWAGFVFVATVAAMIAIAAGYAREGRLGDPTYSGTWFWLQTGLHALALGWGSAESFRYWAVMRRRLRLGLAAPLVTNRFLVWGVAVGAGVLALMAEAVIHGIGVEPVYQGLLVGSASILGGVSLAGYWLTFFPPRAYRRLLLRRAAQR